MATAPIIFILGMHRSGTSCLTGCLERCGLFLGKVDRSGVAGAASAVERGGVLLDNVSRFAQYNPKGHFELVELNALQDEILAANGGSWCSAPPRLEVSQEQRQGMRTILEQFPPDVICGIKDPRTLLLMDTWLELARPCAMVGTFRHPCAVANSLAQRNGMSEAAAFPFWLRYNQELIRLQGQYDFPILEFDLTDVEAYTRNVAALAIKLGLKPDPSQLLAFVSQELDHSHSMSLAVPPECGETYAYLQQHRFHPTKFEMQIVALQQHLASTPGAGPQRNLPNGVANTIDTLHQQVAALERTLVEMKEISGKQRKLIEEQQQEDKELRDCLKRIQSHPLYRARGWLRQKMM